MITASFFQQLSVTKSKVLGTEKAPLISRTSSEQLGIKCLLRQIKCLLRDMPYEL